MGSTPPPLPAHVLKLAAKHSNAATAVGYSPPKKAVYPPTNKKVYSPANNKVVTAPVINLDIASADHANVLAAFKLGRMATGLRQAQYIFPLLTSDVDPV